MASGKMKNRVEVDRRRKENQPSTYVPSSTSDVKFEMMMKTMERLMDMLALDNIPPNREQSRNQIRNPNFRRPPPPPRNQRNPEDQQIRPPFLENLVDEEGEEDPMDILIHHFDDIDSEIYLIEEEHNLFSQEDDYHISEIDSKQYQRGYQNAIDDFQKNIKK